MIEAPPSRDSTPEEVAYHEAGHAVVGHSLGLDLVAVDVLGDSEGGHRRPDWYRPEVSQDERHERFVEAVVITFLAGAIAEARRASFRNPNASGFDLDAVAREWLHLLDSPDEEALMQRAEALVDENWPAIERLAKALMRARRLPGLEALAAAS